MPSWNIHNKFKFKAYDGTGLNLSTGGNTVKLFLADSTVAPTTALEFISDYTGTEVSGTNYTTGGLTLANQTWTEASGTCTFDADDITIAQSATGFTNARYAILYIDTGVATTSPIIASSDLGSDQGNVAGDLTFSWSASGIFTLS